MYGTQEEKELALNLFKYCFYCNGFNFGNDSFIHLAPTELKVNIPNYVRGLNDLLTTEFKDVGNNTINTFISQFFRNHLDNRKLVPEVTSLPNDLFMNDKEVKDNIDIIIRKDDLNVDGLNTELLINSDDTVIVPYFAKTINDKKIYYKLITEGVSEIDKYSYVRVEPLGMKGNFLEYSYGNNDYYTSIVEQEVEAEERYNFPAPMIENDESYYDSFQENDFPFIGNDDKAESYFNELSDNSQEDYIDPIIARFQSSIGEEVDLIRNEIEESKNKCK